MMLVPGENGLLDLLGVDQPTGPAGDLVELDPASWVRKWVLRRPGQFLMFLFALLHLSIMYGLATMVLWRPRHQTVAAGTVVVAALMLIAYLVAVSSGPEAYPRFRAPIAPLLAMLAGLGGMHLRALARGAGRPERPSGPSA
jgi:hypothetical protein